MDYHEPVLLKETIDGLNVQQGFWYVDATVGGGGHTAEILKRGGNVLGLDVDKEALDFTANLLKKEIADGRLILEKANYDGLGEVVRERGLKDVFGVLYDLGVSSWQMNSMERGFSFDSKALDMRMDKDLKVTVQDLLNALPAPSLEKIFTEYGEEGDAKKISRALVEARSRSKIVSGQDLLGVIFRACPWKRVLGNQAGAKVFQALRIALNGELRILEESLPQALKLLQPKGRICAISFHSLEDRIVKKFGDSAEGLRIISKKPLCANEQEVRENSRARSAKLRVFEKL